MKLALLLMTIFLVSLTLQADETVYEFRARSLEQKPCHFKMTKQDDGAYNLKLKVKENILFHKTLVYEFKAQKVETLLQNRSASDSLMIKQDYGTPSREAFTRFELVFVDDVLREVYALKYKNLNYKTKSKYLSCRF
jgi:hypothetical protein